VSTLHHTGFHYEEKQRRKWQNPEEILAEIGLKSGSTFMDIGCGEGFFTIPACRIVGKNGRVFALDIDKKAIAFLFEKAQKAGLTNLVARVGSAEEIVFCECCADIVFFGIDLHDFRDPSRVLMNARRMLKPDGRLIDLDWKKEPTELGPPMRIRFSQDHAAGLIATAGFKIESTTEAGPYHYLIIARL
jgi:ubiquinone/menaquinone biosynthesis C-methylase UbiE